MVVSIPPLRVRAVNDAPIRRGRYVLYWMVAARRTRSSFALDRAFDHAEQLGVPVLVFEPLRADHPWASRRLHAFVMAGMRDNEAACRAAGVTYHGWVEPAPGAGRGLLEALAAHASVVVTDDQGGFFLPRMVAAAGRVLPVRLEAVDGVGLLPVRAADHAFARAVDFRRFLQQTLPAHLAQRPSRHPLARARGMARAQLPPGVTPRWPSAMPVLGGPDPVGLPGGPEAARRRLRAFVSDGLPRYLERAHPDAGAASGLSPYLHFGHLGAHEVWDALVEAEGWSPEAIAPRASGQKQGFWGLSAAAEAFVDECVTWRELGHNFCAHRDDHDRYESLPAWARSTLEKHAGDPRPHLYRLEELAQARTHDPVWNAAQRQLLREGVIHNYLRMLWGKKVLEWSASPREAVAALVELNNRFALDGRDPSSYSGIFWCLGRYDRPWAPERPIFGTVRYMSSESTLKKLRLRQYLARFGDAHP